jgi:competence protein ComEC
MGLLAGFVFMSVRGGLALIPSLALRYPIKKWAALVALPAAAFYLALSGGNVATQRAFIQVAVMLVAILCDRRALTLRSVAIAALIVLAWRPEALLGPGFQMSFAATTALVVVFGATRGRVPRLPVLAAQVVAVLMSSIIAGAATAPISAAHFNQIGQYGVLANLLSVPMMGTIVMPLMVVAGVLSPFGLEGLPLWGMALGLDWILWVSSFVAGLDGALRLIPAPSAWVLPLMCLGILWIIAWQGRARWVGVAPAVLAFALWAQTPRPMVLISASGNLVGVQTAAGRALSKPRGDGFVAENWLAADGLPQDQEAAATLWSAEAEQSHGLMHLYGRGAQERVAAACRGHRAVIANKEFDAPEGCLMLTPQVLRTTGAIAITSEGRVITSRQTQGDRPWVPRAGPAPDLAPLQYVRISPTSRP